MEHQRQQPPTIAFSTVHDAATRLREAAARAGEPLRLLPYNPYDPDNTEWWLSPSPDNPAFKHGKIMLRTGVGATNDLFVGLYLERGIGPGAAPAFKDTPKGRRLVMERDWLWSLRFTAALESGSFAELAKSAETQAGVPLTVTVDGGPVSPPTPGWDYNPHGLIGWDVLRFEFGGGHLRLVDSDLRVGSLSEVSRATTLEELAVGMELTPDTDWVWIDFQIGVLFRKASTLPDEPAWSMDDLWREACQPWTSWLS